MRDSHSGHLELKRAEARSPCPFVDPRSRVYSYLAGAFIDGEGMTIPAGILTGVPP